MRNRLCTHTSTANQPMTTAIVVTTTAVESSHTTASAFAIARARTPPNSPTRPK